MSGFFWIEVLMYSLFLTILINRVRVQTLRPAMLELKIPVETTSAGRPLDFSLRGDLICGEYRS